MQSGYKGGKKGKKQAINQRAYDGSLHASETPMEKLTTL